MARILSHSYLAPIAQQADEENQDNSQFTRSLKSGLYQLGASGAGLGAAIGDVAFLPDAITRAMREQAEEWSAKAEGTRGYNVPEIQDISSLGDAWRWTQDVFGANTPLALSMIGTGGASGVVGAGVGATRGAAGALARGLAENEAKAYTANAASALSKKYADRAVLGTYGGSAAGDNYNANQDNPELDERSNWAKAAAALVTGGAQAYVGTRMFDPLMDTLKHGRGFGKALAIGSLGEGTTEVGEELIGMTAQKMLGADIDFTDPEALNRYLNVFAAGGVFGAGMQTAAKGIHDASAYFGRGGEPANSDAPLPDVPDLAAMRMFTDEGTVKPQTMDVLQKSLGISNEEAQRFEGILQNSWQEYVASVQANNALTDEERAAKLAPENVAAGVIDDILRAAKELNVPKKSLEHRVDVLQQELLTPDEADAGVYADMAAMLGNDPTQEDEANPDLDGVLGTEENRFGYVENLRRDVYGENMSMHGSLVPWFHGTVQQRPESMPWDRVYGASHKERQTLRNRQFKQFFEDVRNTLLGVDEYGVFDQASALRGAPTAGDVTLLQKLSQPLQQAITKFLGVARSTTESMDALAKRKELAQALETVDEVDTETLKRLSPGFQRALQNAVLPAPQLAQQLGPQLQAARTNLAYGTAHASSAREREWYAEAENKIRLLMDEHQIPYTEAQQFGTRLVPETDPAFADLPVTQRLKELQAAEDTGSYQRRSVAEVLASEFAQDLNVSRQYGTLGRYQLALALRTYARNPRAYETAWMDAEDAAVARLKKEDAAEEEAAKEAAKKAAETAKKELLAVRKRATEEELAAVAKKASDRIMQALDGRQKLAVQRLQEETAAQFLENFSLITRDALTIDANKRKREVLFTAADLRGDRGTVPAAAAGDMRQHISLNAQRALVAARKPINTKSLTEETRRQINAYLTGPERDSLDPELLQALERAAKAEVLPDIEAALRGAPAPEVQRVWGKRPMLANPEDALYTTAGLTKALEQLDERDSPFTPYELRTQFQVPESTARFLGNVRTVGEQRTKMIHRLALAQLSPAVETLPVQVQAPDGTVDTMLVNLRELSNRMRAALPGDNEMPNDGTKSVREREMQFLAQGIVSLLNSPGANVVGASQLEGQTQQQLKQLPSNTFAPSTETLIRAERSRIVQELATLGGIDTVDPADQQQLEDTKVQLLARAAHLDELDNLLKAPASEERTQELLRIQANLKGRQQQQFEADSQRAKRIAVLLATMANVRELPPEMKEDGDKKLRLLSQELRILQRQERQTALAQRAEAHFLAAEYALIQRVLRAEAAPSPLDALPDSHILREFRRDLGLAPITLGELRAYHGNPEQRWTQVLAAVDTQIQHYERVFEYMGSAIQTLKEQYEQLQQDDPYLADRQEEITQTITRLEARRAELVENLIKTYDSRAQYEQFADEVVRQQGDWRGTFTAKYGLDEIQRPEKYEADGRDDITNLPNDAPELQTAGDKIWTEVNAVARRLDRLRQQRKEAVADIAKFSVGTELVPPETSTRLLALQDRLAQLNGLNDPNVRASEYYKHLQEEFAYASAQVNDRPKWLQRKRERAEAKVAQLDAQIAQENKNYQHARERAGQGNPQQLERQLQTIETAMRGEQQQRRRYLLDLQSLLPELQKELQRAEREAVEDKRPGFRPEDTRIWDLRDDVLRQLQDSAVATAAKRSNLATALSETRYDELVAVARALQRETDTRGKPATAKKLWSLQHTAEELRQAERAVDRTTPNLRRAKIAPLTVEQQETAAGVQKWLRDAVRYLDPSAHQMLLARVQEILGTLDRLQAQIAQWMEEEKRIHDALRAIYDGTEDNQKAANTEERAAQRKQMALASVRQAEAQLQRIVQEIQQYLRVGPAIKGGVVPAGWWQQLEDMQATLARHEADVTEATVRLQLLQQAADPVGLEGTASALAAELDIAPTSVELLLRLSPTPQAKETTVAMGTYQLLQRLQARMQQRWAAGLADTHAALTEASETEIAEGATPAAKNYRALRNWIGSGKTAQVEQLRQQLGLEVDAIDPDALPNTLALRAKNEDIAEQNQKYDALYRKELQDAEATLQETEATIREAEEVGGPLTAETSAAVSLARKRNELAQRTKTRIEAIRQLAADSPSKSLAAAEYAYDNAQRKQDLEASVARIAAQLENPSKLSLNEIEELADRQEHMQWVLDLAPVLNGNIVLADVFVERLHHHALAAEVLQEDLAGIWSRIEQNDTDPAMQRYIVATQELTAEQLRLDAEGQQVREQLRELYAKRKEMAKGDPDRLTLQQQILRLQEQRKALRREADDVAAKYIPILHNLRADTLLQRHLPRRINVITMALEQHRRLRTAMAALTTGNTLPWLSEQAAYALLRTTLLQQTTLHKQVQTPKNIGLAQAIADQKTAVREALARRNTATRKLEKLQQLITTVERDPNEAQRAWNNNIRDLALQQTKAERALTASKAAYTALAGVSEQTAATFVRRMRALSDARTRALEDLDTLRGQLRAEPARRAQLQPKIDRVLHTVEQYTASIQQVWEQQVRAFPRTEGGAPEALDWSEAARAEQIEHARQVARSRANALLQTTGLSPKHPSVQAYTEVENSEGGRNRQHALRALLESWKRALQLPTDAKMLTTAEWVAALSQYIRDGRTARFIIQQKYDSVVQEPAEWEDDKRKAWERQRGSMQGQLEALAARGEDRSADIVQAKRALASAKKAAEQLQRVELGQRLGVGGQRVILPDGSVGLWIDPTLEETVAHRTMLHEMGEWIFADLVTEAKTSGQYTQLIKELQDEIATHIGSKGTNLTTRDRQRLFTAWFTGEIADAPLSAEDIEYVNAANEYFAEHIARWAMREKEPRSVSESFFAGIGKAIKKMLLAFVEFVTKRSYKNLVSQAVSVYEVSPSVMSYMTERWVHTNAKAFAREWSYGKAERQREIAEALEAQALAKERAAQLYNEDPEADPVMDALTRQASVAEALLEVAKQQRAAAEALHKEADQAEQLPADGVAAEAVTAQTEEAETEAEVFAPEPPATPPLEKASDAELRAEAERIRHSLHKEEWLALMELASRGNVKAVIRTMLPWSRAVHQQLNDPTLSTMYLVRLLQAAHTDSMLETYLVRSLVRAVEARDIVIWQPWQNRRGVLTPRQKIPALFEVLHPATLSKRLLQTSPSVVTMSEAGQKAQHSEVVTALHKMGEWFAKNVYNRLFETGVQRIHETDNPIARAIANLFGSTPTTRRGADTGVQRAYTFAQREFYGSFVAEVLGENAENVAFVRGLTRAFNDPRSVSKLPEDVRKAHAKLQNWFMDIRRYAASAGVNDALLDQPGDLGDLPPVLLFNRSKLQAHFDVLLEYAKRPEFAAQWDALRSDSINATLRALNARGSTGSMEATRISVEQNTPKGEAFIEHYLRMLLVDEGHIRRAETTEVVIRNPWLGYVNHNAVAFLAFPSNGADAAIFRNFLTENITDAMFDYTRYVTRRVEFARRAGQYGERLAKLLQELQDSNPEPGLVRMVLDFADGQMGSYGWRTHEALVKWAEGSIAPEAFKKLLADDSNKIISPRLQKLFGSVTLYQFYRLLPLSAFSNSMDPLGAVIKTGEFGMGLRSIQYALKSQFKRWSGPDTLWAMRTMDNLGIAIQHLISTEMAAEFSDNQFSPRQRRWIDNLMKWNGTQWVTRLGRMTMVFAANDYILKHAEAASLTAEGTPNTSMLRLMELNLSPKDIIPGETLRDGRLYTLSYGERAELRASTDPAAQDRLDLDDRIRTAVHDMVDGGSVRPDPSHVPMYMNDPHWTLFTMLQKFIHTFDQTILRNAWKEFTEYGNLRPLLALALLFIPFMMFADWLRDMIKYGPDGAPWKEDWGVIDYIQYASSRAGLDGRESLIAAPLTNLFIEGDIPGNVAKMLGPNTQQINFIVQYGPSTRELPLQVLWRDWF